jgi:N-acetylglucosaminyldiphosphoundecaprenol N-acetyl-beta-D-mannosaminyltransferase
MSTSGPRSYPCTRRTTGPPLPIALLGLVFDPVTLEDAQAIVCRAAENRQKLVFATPNVNFLASAAQTPSFRRQVLQCHLSLVDGMPLVWIGRLLGLQIPERVSGSSLFEALQHDRGHRPLRVFFFGGDPGVAQLATGAISRDSPGVLPAGYLDPGRGSVEDMSSDEIIATINAAHADFLCVALGAVKGHAWIARNASRLNAPVISHLGAVVNFVAGRIQRAPRWMQRCGLEWAWRIMSEPVLLKRYARDGLWLLDALTKQVLPACLTRMRPRREAGDFSWWCVGGDAGRQSLILKGHLTGTALLQNPDFTALVPPAGTMMSVDMHELMSVDSHGVAWLLRFCYSIDTESSIKLEGVNARTRKCLRLFGADFISGEFT